MVLTASAWAEMAVQWWNISTYNHILFIPPIVAWLVWLRRTELQAAAARLLARPRARRRCAVRLAAGGTGGREHRGTGRSCGCAANECPRYTRAAGNGRPAVPAGLHGLPRALRRRAGPGPADDYRGRGHLAHPDQRHRGGDRRRVHRYACRSFRSGRGVFRREIPDRDDRPGRAGRPDMLREVGPQAGLHGDLHRRADHRQRGPRVGDDLYRPVAGYRVRCRLRSHFLWLDLLRHRGCRDFGCGVALLRPRSGGAGN